MGRPNEVFSEVLRSRGIEPIVAESTDESASLASFLTSLRANADEFRSSEKTINGKGIV